MSGNFSGYSQTNCASRVYRGTAKRGEGGSERKWKSWQNKNELFVLHTNINHWNICEEFLQTCHYEKLFQSFAFSVLLCLNLCKCNYNSFNYSINLIWLSLHLFGSRVDANWLNFLKKTCERQQNWHLLNAVLRSYNYRYFFVLGRLHYIGSMSL